MPRQPSIHYNGPDTGGRAACGRQLRRVRWTADKTEVNCGNCLKAPRFLSHPSGRKLKKAPPPEETVAP